MSDKKRSPADIALTLGLPVFLFVSYGFDKASDSIGNYISTHDIKNLPFGSLITFVYPTALLLLGITAFSVYWVMIRKFHPSTSVKMLYFFVGLVVVATYSMSRMFKNPDAFPDALEQTFWPLSYLHIAGSLVFVVGLFTILMPRSYKKEETPLSNVLVFLGLPIFLYICHLLRTTHFYITSYFAKYKILFWFYPVALSFVVATVLLMFWFVQNGVHYRKSKKYFFLVIGFFITYFYNILGLKVVRELIPPSWFGGQIPALILLQDVFWPKYYLHIAGTLITATGLLLLLPDTENKSASVVL